MGAGFVTRTFVMVQTKTTGSTLCKHDLKVSSSMKEETNTNWCSSPEQF